MGEREIVSVKRFEDGKERDREVRGGEWMRFSVKERAPLPLPSCAAGSRQQERSEMERRERVEVSRVARRQARQIRVRNQWV